MTRMMTLCWILLLLATMGIQGSDNSISYPCPTKCACYFRGGGEYLVDVYCGISWPLSSHTTNFSILQTDIPSILYLQCDSLLNAELSDYMFSNLQYFVGLSMRDCRFSHIPRHAFSGMTSLKLLVIYNAHSPIIHPQAFEDTPQLTHLSIVESNLRSVPNLCNLAGLKFLNLSHNAIQDLSDAGIVCDNGTTLQNLTFLVLSSNSLTNIDVDIGNHVPHLWQYILTNNRITSLRRESLHNLPDLGYFDVSSNKISSIGYDIFRFNHQVRIMKMGNNPLPVLPSGIFHSFSDLQVISLPQAQLDDKIWQELFYLTTVTQVELGNNNITSIDKTVLSNWKNVEYLDLSENHIGKLADNTFYNQYKLRSLFLSKNRITTVERLAFNGLLNVTRLELQHNQIIDMHNDSLHFLPSLEALNISYNYLKEIPALNDLHDLVWIDIRRNYIENLTSATFSGLTKLGGISLMWNELKYISRTVFTPLKSLNTLNLAHNDIYAIESGAFAGLENLLWLRLSNNNISDISFVYNIGRNLFNLDLSSNAIKGTINSNTFPNNLQYLDLSKNEITGVDMYTFYKFERLRSVNLKFNSIKTLAQASMYVSRNTEPKPFIYLSGNRFVCDCRLKWLREEIDKSRPSRGAAIIPDLDVILCVEGFRAETTFLYKLDPNQMLCEYKEVCPYNCECCKFHCHCQYICPDMCSCYRTMTYSPPNYVICSNNNFTQVPARLPAISTYVYLDGNNFTKLIKHQFLDLSGSVYLYLNNSHIRSIENRTFIGLKSLRVLSLKRNALKLIFHGMFAGLENLVELNLEQNLISEIQVAAFKDLTSLERLYLRDNLLTLVPVSFFTFTSSLHDLTLSGNRWSCDCDFLSSFVHRTFEMADSISDRSHVQCAIDSENYTTLYNLNELNLQKHCPNVSFVNITYDRNITLQSVQRLEDKTEPVVFAGAIACVCVVFIFFFIVFWKRDFIQLVLYTKFGCRVCQENDDFTKHYDAFISYSSHDENFVVHQLVPKLESPGHGFKLCVHYRDFPVGASIAETIIKSIESSRRTILVLSNNFLKSEWCQYEFQTAHHQALRDKNCKLIVILRHELDPKSLDPELKLYLKTRTYLKYGDPWFWDKLYYAMPNVRSASEEHLLQENSYNISREFTRVSTPDIVNTVCGSMQDDEGYETPIMSRPTSEVNTITRDSLSLGKLSSHSSNIYEEIT